MSFSTASVVLFLIDPKGPHAGRGHRRSVPGPSALLEGGVLHVVLRDTPQPRRDRRAFSGAGGLHSRELVVFFLFFFVMLSLADGCDVM